MRHSIPASATNEELAPALAAKARDVRAFALGRRLFRTNTMRLAGLVVLAVLVCGVAPGLLAPQDPFAQSLTRRLAPAWFLPGHGVAGYWLGTDQLGRDMLSRMIYGARITLLVSVLAVMVSGVTGVAAGVVAGTTGGRTDTVILRLIDVQLAFPVVLLVIAVVAVIGPSTGNLVVIMGLSGWPRFARIVRGSVLQVRTFDYVEAVRAVGATEPRVMLRHVLPNILPAVIVYATFEMARMILLEATLSFLGLGIQPPVPTWGGMINDGRRYMAISWGVSLYPGLCIVALILAISMLGDQLRDTLDPRVRDG